MDDMKRPASRLRSQYLTQSGEYNDPTFHYFSKLPKELRDKIWSLSITPRIVKLVWKSQISTAVTPQVPSILHVSHEARLEGLRAYATANPNIFFSYDLDTAALYGGDIGPFVDFRKVILPQLRAHYALLRRLSIDGLTFDLASGLVLNPVTVFPLLEIFSITGCVEGILQAGDFRSIKIVNPDDSSPLKPEKMPILRCDKNGFNCRAHWWFAQWNDVRRRDVESWGNAYHVVVKAIRERQGRSDLLGPIDVSS